MTILKNKHKIIGFILTIVLVLALFIWVAPTKVSAEVVVDASGTCGENLTWQLTYDNAVEVVEYTLTISGTGAMTEFGSPDDIPWVNYNITSVVINEGVTSIGSYAFSGCALTAIEIPKSVTYIGSSAFSQTALSSIRFKSATPPTLGVTEDGISNLFGDIDMLPIYVPAYAVQTYQQSTDGDWENYTSQITAWVIQRGYCGGTDDMPISFEITEYSENDEYVLTISGSGDMTTSISESGVPLSPWHNGNEQHITSITFDGQSYITSISDGAFAGFTALTSLTIPDSVEVIGACVFNGCTALTEITIPSGAGTINDSAFYGCSSLTKVTFNISDDGINNLSYIGSGAFAGCGITSIEIPEFVSEIGVDAFANCSSLTTVYLNNREMGSLGPGAFDGCSNLKKIYLPQDKMLLEWQSYKGWSEYPELLVQWGDYSDGITYELQGTLDAGHSVTLDGSGAM
ncbi:MAG: leucine-rich repeat domain-containing protein, partial [Oscillospiraceae bacterium]|nr:leucine-rich repeat domain-containing protein [Oscillospiraceae bacterium]